MKPFINKIKSIIFILSVLSFVLLFINGCSDNNSNNDLNNFDWREYTFPSEYEHMTFVIEEQETDYSGYTYIYENNDLTDEEKQAIFESWSQRKEDLDKYETLTDVWNQETFEELEEERIEQYCEDNGFFSCYNIKYTCETEYRCQKVYIECEDYGFDPEKLSHQYYGQDMDDECRHYKVTVDENDFDIRKLDNDNYLDDAGYQWE